MLPFPVPHADLYATSRGLHPLMRLPLLGTVSDCLCNSKHLLSCWPYLHLNFSTNILCFKTLGGNIQRKPQGKNRVRCYWHGEKGSNFSDTRAEAQPNFLKSLRGRKAPYLLQKDVSLLYSQHYLHPFSFYLLWICHSINQPPSQHSIDQHPLLVFFHGTRDSHI